MLNPYSVLGITPETSDADTRLRYLELIREFTPELHPEKFADIRRAFELVGTLSARAEYHLIGFVKHVTLDDLVQEWKCRNPVRLKLDQLVKLAESR